MQKKNIFEKRGKKIGNISQIRTNHSQKSCTARRGCVSKQQTNSEKNKNIN